MGTYKSYNRRRVNFKLISALFAGVALISTIGLGVMNLSTSKKLTKAQTSIETIKTEKSTIEAQIPTLETSIKELTQEVDNMQNILWRYQPVVIPDSMK